MTKLTPLFLGASLAACMEVPEVANEPDERLFYGVNANLHVDPSLFAPAPGLPQLEPYDEAYLVFFDSRTRTPPSWQSSEIAVEREIAPVQSLVGYGPVILHPDIVNQMVFKIKAPGYVCGQAFYFPDHSYCGVPALGIAATSSCVAVPPGSETMSPEEAAATLPAIPGDIMPGTIDLTFDTPLNPYFYMQLQTFLYLNLVGSDC